MEYGIRERDDILVIDVPRNGVSFDTAEVLEDFIIRFLDAGKTRIVLNMAKVDFIDSRGLGVLLALHSRSSQGGSLALCCILGKVGQVMSLTQMDRILNLFGTEDDAVAFLRDR
ncbi:MAG: STAS domain-containing protein [Desulfovibrionaceae bacterium]